MQHRMHAWDFVQQWETVTLGYFKFQIDINQQNTKRWNGGLQMKNVREYICLYADLDFANVHQKRSSCICMESCLTQEFHLYGPVFQQKDHLHSKRLEKKNDKKPNQTSCGWGRKRRTMKSPSAVKELLTWTTDNRTILRLTVHSTQILDLNSKSKKNPSAV